MMASGTRLNKLRQRDTAEWKVFVFRPARLRFGLADYWLQKYEPGRQLDGSERREVTPVSKNCKVRSRTGRP